MDYSDIDRIDKEIKITETICKLAKANKLIWERNELGYYLASNGNLKGQIEFFNFSRMDEQSSDDSCGTVSITISYKSSYKGLAFDFSVGTKQFSNLKKAISHNFKDWKDGLQRGGRKYIEVLEYLENIQSSKKKLTLKNKN